MTDPSWYSILGKIAEGSPLIVLLLLFAVWQLWKELAREREERIKALAQRIEEKAKLISDYKSFEFLLKDFIKQASGDKER